VGGDVTEYIIHARIKNNLILKRILARYKNVNEFCNANGLRADVVGQLINLKKPALSKRNRVNSPKWTRKAQRLADALGVLPEDLFTEEQASAELCSNQAFIEMTRQQALSLVDPLVALEARELVTKMLSNTKLSERHKEVLRLRFNEDLALEEIGQRLGVSANRAMQIEAQALRKLRHRAQMSNML
jgi:RNA polymerase sigma factor (sigma-70 family)